MKFATLIALTSVAAIRITQKATEGPSAADVIGMCDKDGDDMLSKPEVMSCIDKFVKNPKHNKEAKAMVNKHWKQVAGKDNKVSEAELEKAMEDHSELAQKKGKKGPKGDKKPRKDSDDEGSESDHSDKEESDDDHKELAQKKGKKGPKGDKKPKKDSDSEGSESDHSDSSDSEEEDDHKELAQGPHDAQIEKMAEGLIKHCDKGEKDGQLTKAEAIGCGCPAKMADEIFGAGGADVNGDGKLSKAEIEGLIKEMMKRGPPALAQGPIDDFIKHCDTSKDGELNKKEVIACGVPKSSVDQAWPHIDKDHSGTVSKAELEAFFGKH